MSFKPKAIFTFFSLTTCGYCKIYKGEIKNKDGSISIDPKSGWEVLRNDPELYDAGVQFELYQVGNMTDPKTGKTKRYELEPGYKGKFKGYPHLQISIPGDPYNGIAFDGRISGWEASKSYPVVKKWILEKLKSDSFKRYGRSGNVASNPAQQAVNSIQQSPNAREQRNVRAPPPIRAQQERPPQQGKSFQQQRRSYQEEVYAKQAGEFGPTQSGDAIPAQSMDQLPGINQMRQSRNPSVFGMGTTALPSVPEEPEYVSKRTPKFLPANYDQ